jgi:ERCC4-type nuclease
MSKLRLFTLTSDGVDPLSYEHWKALKNDYDLYLSNLNPAKGSAWSNEVKQDVKAISSFREAQTTNIINKLAASVEAKDLEIANLREALRSLNDEKLQSDHSLNRVLDKVLARIPNLNIND